MPLSAGQCEQAISAQNGIKNCHRASLVSQTAEDLIRISAEGPPQGEFNPTGPVATWFTSPGDRKDNGVAAMLDDRMFCFVIQHGRHAIVFLDLQGLVANQELQ